MPNALSRHVRQHAVGYLALFVALGGTSYAATLPRNSVGPTQLRAGAVTSLKVKDGSLLVRDFKAGQLPRGAQGPAGDRGPAGPAGTAVAYAHLTGTGGVEAAASKGVAASNVGHPDTGIYCLHDLGFTPRHAIATPGTSPDGYLVQVDVGTGGSACPAGTQVTVLMADESADAIDADVWLMLS